MPPLSTSFRGVADYGRSLVSEQISINLIEWAKWCFLGVGAFQNVRMPTSGAYGGDYSRLRLSESPYFAKGRVWEGARANWVWESGIEYRTQPIQISGVTVDGTFLPSNTVGNSGFFINYPNGQVIFNTALSPSSVVRTEYSFRHVNVYSDNTPWFKEIMTDSFRVDSSQFLQYGSGAWSTLAQNRVQLPAVVVEAVPRFTNVGYQLGAGQTLNTDVAFWVISQNAPDRNQIVDTLRYQNDRTIVFFDRNLLASGHYPLSPSGNLNPNSAVYPRWLVDYPWKTCRLKDVAGMDVGNQTNLYMGYIRFTTEIVHEGI